MAFFMQFGPFFYDDDKMFILTLMLCISKSCKIQVTKWQLSDNFSHQGEKASCIGDYIGHNFEP